MRREEKRGFFVTLHRRGGFIKDPSIVSSLSFLAALFWTACGSGMRRVVSAPALFCTDLG